MKILYTHNIFTLQKNGGISRQMYEIANNLSNDEKIKIKVLNFFSKNDYLFEKKSNKNQLNYHKFLATDFFYYKYFKNFLYVFNDFITSLYLFFKNPNIIHETYYPVFFLKNNKSKYVTTIHDMIYEKFSEYRLKKKIIIDAKKKSIIRSDHIVCVSENTKKDLMSIYNIDEKKISVIYPGLFNTEKIVDNLNFEKRIFSEKYILYVGSRNFHKNFIFFIKAFCKTKIKKKLNIVCFGGGTPSNEEYKIFKDLEISNNLKFYNGSDEDLANLYFHAEFFVYPSLYEGFGVPPLEAMYFNCPVLSSNSSSLPEAVGEAALTFNPYNELDMIKKMELISEDEKLRKKLILLGKERVKKFSWKSCAEKNYKVYSDLLNET